jgi:hypothetical protein
MTSRCKVWAALWLVLLANLFASASIHAATFPVDAGATYMTPDSLPGLVPGDSVLFKIGRNQILYLDGTPMFGGATLSQGTEHLYTFNEEGTFNITSTRGPYSYCTITVTRPVNAAPTVAITNLALRIAIKAGSNVTFRASALDEDGSITKVEYRYGSNGLPVNNVIFTSTAAPYEFIWTNPAPGKYVVQARAYDNLAVSANSQPINLSLYTPFTNTLPAITNVSGVNNIVFRFNTDTGLVYVIEVSTNLVNWDSILTNTATNNFIEVLDPNLSALTNRFYRLRLVP